MCSHVKPHYGRPQSLLMQAKAIIRSCSLRLTGEFRSLDATRFTQVKHNLDDLLSQVLIKKDLDRPKVPESS